MAAATLTRGEVAARIEAIDVSEPASDYRSMERALRGYLDALGVDGGSIEWAGDLREAHERYFGPNGRRRAYRGRWQSYSVRERRLRDAHAWGIPGGVAPTLLGLEQQLRSLLVPVGFDPGRSRERVRLATACALGLANAVAKAGGIRSTREHGALACLLEAAEAGVMGWWPANGAIVAVPRPALRIEAGVLHRWDGQPAVSWANGRSYYFWRGVHMTERVGCAPDGLTGGRIRHTSNAERRRVMIERYGTERFLRDVGSELIAQDDLGRLWRTPRPVGRNEQEPLALVEVVNSTQEPDGSYRHYFLRVPPTTRTARAAVAWTFGFDSAADYLVTLQT
jgi:hypothetical protein